MKAQAIAAFAACLLCVAGEARAQDAGFTWRVTDRFRLFATEPQSADEITAAPRESQSDIFLSDLAQARRGDCDEATLDVPARPDVDPRLILDERRVACIYRALNAFYELDIRDSSRPYQSTTWSRTLHERGYARGYISPEVIAVRVAVPMHYRRADFTCEWRLGVLSALLPCDTEALIPLPVETQVISETTRIYARGTVETAVSSGDGVRVAHMSETLTVRDRLIISLGDSYSAGEGNADRATDWRPLNRGLDDPGDAEERWWWQRRNVCLVHYEQDCPPTRTLFGAEEPVDTEARGFAQWWDPWCRRSLSSQHLIAALLTAADDNQSTVTFASFSCSGGTIFSGLVLPQERPPGVPEAGPLPPTSQISQIEALQRLLCPTSFDDSASPAPAEDWVLRLTENPSNRATTRLPMETPPRYLAISAAERGRLLEEGPRRLARCRDEQGTDHRLRHIDAILLSFGGNDVGFPGVVKDAMLPSSRPGILGSSSLAGIRNAMQTVPPAEASRRIRLYLPSYYRVAEEALQAALPDHDLLVIQSRYPDPLNNEDGRFCDGYNDNRLLAASRGFLPDQRTPRNRRWSFEITAAEGRVVREAMVEPLNSAIERHAADARARGMEWYVANNAGTPHTTLFDTHGWCAVRNSAEEADFQLPYWDQYLAEWAPIRPSDFEAYPDRMPLRWFRTPNDAVMAGMSSNRRREFGPWDFATGPSAALGGAFHPNRAGQTAMALYVYEALEQHTR